MRLKTILSLLLFSQAALFSQSNGALMDSANNAYAKNKFDESVKYYSRILSNGYESAPVYFNIGNAYYKKKSLALAILNYEKAKKISPSDEDINYNLKLANAKLIDKIEVLPQLFIKDWWNGIILLVSEKAWSILSIASLWLSMLFLVLYFLSGRRTMRQIGFTVAMLCLLTSAFSFFVAKKSSALNSSHNSGIILSLSVSIKGSPSDQGTDLFILHEGTKVAIEQTASGWTEIRIPNGNRGWIKSEELGVI